MNSGDAFTQATIHGHDMYLVKEYSNKHTRMMKCRLCPSMLVYSRYNGEVIRQEGILLDCPKEGATP